MLLSEQIIAWLKDQIKASGAKGFVVGLSGGIDSATSAAIVDLGRWPKYFGPRWYASLVE